MGLKDAVEISWTAAGQVRQRLQGFASSRAQPENLVKNRSPASLCKCNWKWEHMNKTVKSGLEVLIGGRWYPGPACKFLCIV